MEEVIYIDLDGNIIQYKNICSHIGLALKLIDENKELKYKFINSNNPRADLFIINDIGYISVSIDPIYGISMIANKKMLTDIQRTILNNYLICGAKLSLIESENNHRYIKSID